VKFEYERKKIPLETKNKIIKAIKNGETNAEAAQMYGLNIGTVYNLTRSIIEGHQSQGTISLARTGLSFLIGL
jgi:transposase